MRLWDGERLERWKGGRVEGWNGGSVKDEPVVGRVSSGGRTTLGNLWLHRIVECNE